MGERLKGRLNSSSAYVFSVLSNVTVLANSLIELLRMMSCTVVLIPSARHCESTCNADMESPPRKRKFFSSPIFSMGRSNALDQIFWRRVSISEPPLVAAVVASLPPEIFTFTSSGMFSSQPFTFLPSSFPLGIIGILAKDTQFEGTINGCSVLRR